MPRPVSPEAEPPGIRHEPAASRATRLTNVVGQASAPVFQPNGQRVAYVNY